MIIKLSKLKHYLIGLLIIVCLLFSNATFARIELVELSFAGNKIKIVIESRSPISFEYYTNENTRQFGVLLEGDDYYPALTKYFQSIDVEQLGQCIDDITIIPVSNNAARLEVRLARGLVASAYDDTANSPRNFRIIIQYVALDENSPCFAGQGDRGDGAGEMASPRTPPPAVFNNEAENLRPFNASEIEQAQNTEIAEAPDNTRSRDRGRTSRTDDTNKIDYSAYVLFDFLAFTNKGGLQGDNWLQQEAGNELRAAEFRLDGNISQWKYQLALLAEHDSKHELTVLPYRVAVGYAFDNIGIQFDAGILAEPFGGEVSNGIDRLPFLERSLTASLANEYNPGVKVRFGNIETFNVEMGVFGKRPTSSEPRSQSSTTFRALYTPYRIGQSALMLGYSHRIWEPVDNNYTLTARPESNLISALSATTNKVFFVNQANVDSVTTSGINMFMNLGALFLSVETITSTLDLSAVAAPASVNQVTSRSLWGSWILTGESHKIVHGQLQRLTPFKPFKFGGPGWGAFEAGLRLSEISDSESQKLTARSISGVWYLDGNLQLKMNWVFAVYSEQNIIVDNDADIVEIRMQYQY